MKINLFFSLLTSILFLVSQHLTCQNDSALIFYNKNLEIFNQTNNKLGLAQTLNAISVLNLKGGDIIEALYNAEKSFSVSNQIGSPENIKNSANTLMKIYRLQNKPAKALEMYELYILIRDSLYKSKARESAKKQHFKYEWEKHEVQLKAEQDKKDAIWIKEKKKQQFIIWFVAAAIITVVMFFLFLYKRFRISREQKKIIEVQKKKVEIAFALLHEKNKQVVDSINYARRIQLALITSENYISKTLNKLMPKHD